MQYDMIFEGGGAKGIVFIGAMKAFEEAGHTTRRLIGTSAGAITAALFAAGLTADDFSQAMSQKLPNGKPRFTSFMDVPESFSEDSIKDSLTYQILADVDIPYVPDNFEQHVDRLLVEAMMKVSVYRNMFSLIERGGWYAGNEFLVWFREVLNTDRRNLAHTTLSEFHTKHPNKELTVIAADTTGNERLILNHRTAPDCPVVWAVRMSMSIPFIWQEVIWQKEWGLYRGRDISGHSVVDGGVLSNFAIDLLVSQEPDVQEIMNTVEMDINPLGFLIDEKEPVPGAETLSAETSETENLLSKIDVKKLKTVQRITRLVETLMQSSDKSVIRSHQDCVCYLPAGGYGTTEFDMSDAKHQALVDIGHKTMAEFLARESKTTNKAEK